MFNTEELGYFNNSLKALIIQYSQGIESINISIPKKSEEGVIFYFHEYYEYIYREVMEELFAGREINDLINSSKNTVRDIMETLRNPERTIGNNVYNILTDQNIFRNILINIVIFHTLLRLRNMSLFEVKTIENYDQLQELSKETNCWYRGQSSASWKLVPSYYRSLGAKTVNVDYYYLVNEYSRMHIAERISSIIPKSLLTYQQLAFIQHSLAFTPLLDFTTNIMNAASFAVSNLKKPNIMQDEPAVIFKIKVEDFEIIKEEKEADNAIKHLNVEYIGSKPYLATLIKSKMWIELMRGTTRSEIKLIDIKTNDRMRMQNGTFVIFDNALVLKDDIIFSFLKLKTLSKVITKYEIKVDKNQRYNIYSDIMKNDSKYFLSNMMNPYDYMKN